MQLLQKRACEWTHPEIIFSFQTLTNILPTVKCPRVGCLALNQPVGGGGGGGMIFENSDMGPARFMILNTISPYGLKQIRIPKINNFKTTEYYISNII